ncbi:MAG: hypothetical protein Q4A53_01615, partial [Porphyromonas sp.]|nr:hypothetical protein [Porphyromonas sp.]
MDKAFSIFRTLITSISGSGEGRRKGKRLLFLLFLLMFGMPALAQETNSEPPVKRGYIVNAEI